MEIEVELKITYFDTMTKYLYSQNSKLIGNSEFNHLTIILTTPKGIGKENGNMNITRLQSLSLCWQHW